jgi:hypothetical protein
MNEVTRILSAIEHGDPHAAEQLLPLVYGELRRLAAQKLACEKPGQTLDATALVHEAYLRLVDGAKAHDWNGRGHFFAAAAEALCQSSSRTCGASRPSAAAAQPGPVPRFTARVPGCETQEMKRSRTLSPEFWGIGRGRRVTNRRTIDLQR